MTSVENTAVSAELNIPYLQNLLRNRQMKEHFKTESMLVFNLAFT